MPGWQILSSAEGESERPTLLIRGDFEPNKYAVYITDLVHIWQGLQSRKDIIKRAVDDETLSIKPYDGDSQFELFLEKVRIAVEGQRGTLRRLLPDGNGPGLILETQTELPAPLRPLIWRLSLRQVSGEVLFRQLLLPTFEKGLRTQEQVGSLLSHINEKDHVITRLVDKLENSGIDLSNVFPSATNTRGPKTTGREALFRAAPGLRGFDEARWRQTTSQEHSANNTDLFRAVFAELDDSPLAVDWKSPDHWWTKLTEEGEPMNAEQYFSVGPQPASATLDSTQSTTADEDGFQVQDTSKLQSKRATTSTVQVKDSQAALVAPPSEAMSTTDDDDAAMDDGDLDVPANDPVIAKSHSDSTQLSQLSEHRSSAEPKKIGLLGKKRMTATASPSPVPETAPIAMSQTPPSPRPPEPSRKKLGKIGHSRQQKHDADLKELPLRESVASPKTEDASLAEETRRKAREGGSSLKETDEEKAERRRNELKHDLDDKKKAPAKKRRKF